MSVRVDDLAYQVSGAIKQDVYDTRVFQCNRDWCIEVSDLGRKVGVLRLFEKKGELKIKIDCSKQKSMFKRWGAMARRFSQQAER